MTLFTYRCTSCGREILSSTRADQIEYTDCCTAWGQRVWGFSPARIMHSHFNHSVGKPVSSMRGFEDALKAKSEEASERLGIEHNFKPVDIAERKYLGVTDEGINEG